MFRSLKKWWADLPEKKKWIDLITAFLTVPVLITVIIFNISRLKEEKKRKNIIPTPEVIYITKEIVNTSHISPTIVSSPFPTGDGRPSVTPVCSLDPEPFEIVFPKEDEKVNTDPVCVILESKRDGFCETKWSYRINNSTWFSYTNDPICLYNMAEGLVKLEVRTKNIVSGREKTYVRNFIYKKDYIVVPTLTLVQSPTQ